MTQAREGDKVKVNYTGTLPDGTVFDSSLNRKPLEFTIGEGKILRGFEKAVVGMAQGESKTAKIPPQEAYGLRDEAKILLIEKERFSGDVESVEGERIPIKLPDGGTKMFTVGKVAEGKVLLDGNHPLAGKELTFEIELLAVG